MRKLGIFALTIAGIVIVFQGLQFIFNSLWILPAMLNGDGQFDYPSLALFAVGILLTITLGVVLILKRSSLAAWLFEESEVDLALDGIAIVRAGLIIFGLITISAGVVDLISAISIWGSTLTLQSQLDMEVLQDPSQQWGMVSRAVIAAFEIGFGWLLAFRSGMVAGRLWRDPLHATASQEEQAKCPTCGAGFDPAEYRDTSVARCTECGSPLSTENA